MSEVALNSSADCPEVERRPSRQRSRITNGTALLPGVDGRGPWVRRCKDVIALHLSDLGGEANTTVAERSIIRRVSVLTCELERLEAKFAVVGNEPTLDDLHCYQRLTNTLRRALQVVRIRHRPPKDVTPHPLEYSRQFPDDDEA
jgi:hypothetical protein